MPGRNCAFPQCTVSFTKKHEGISLFQIPTRKDEFYTNWRNNIVQVLDRFRKVDKSLSERISAGNVYICERHFTADDIEYTSELFFILFISFKAPASRADSWTIINWFHIFLM